MGLLITLKGLPLGYNKDLQEDKEPLFDAIDTLELALPVLAGAVATMEPQPNRLTAALDDAMLATDLADWLVAQGIPFRQSHHVAGEVVREAERRHCGLRDLDLVSLQRIHPAFTADALGIWDFERSVEQRSAPGGTAAPPSSTRSPRPGRSWGPPKNPDTGFGVRAIRESPLHRTPQPLTRHSFLAHPPSPMYHASFRCFRGCPGEWPLYEVIYTCPTCGGLLEVSHDTDALGDRSGAAWMRLFEARSGTTDFPYGSGVWRKKEWVAPTWYDENIVTMFEGNTNLFWAAAPGRADRRGRPVGQAVRQQPHRLVQRPGHDRAGQRRQADDGQRQAHPRRGLRLHRRHLGRLGRLWRRCRHPHHRLSAPGQGLRRPTDPAHRQRRHSSCRWIPISTAACASSKK